MTGLKADLFSSSLNRLSPELASWKAPTRAQEAFKYTNLKRLQTLESVELGEWKFDLQASAHDRSQIFFDRASRLAAQIPQLPIQSSLQSFGQLNQALEKDPFVLYVPADLQLKDGLKISAQFQNKDNAVYTPALHIILGSRSSAKIFEVIRAGHERSLVAGVTRVHLASEAFVEHVRCVDGTAIQFHEAFAQVAAGAKYHSTNITLASARTDHHVWLMDSGAECKMHGLYKIKSKDEADFHTVIEHRAPATTSSQFYKGILDDDARGIFNGRVHIYPQAQKSIAEQVNKNLLLSDRAEIDTKPELQISADDVKATHGATVGQIDADQLFYLISRGVPAEAARDLLIEGFAGEILDFVTEPQWRHDLNQWSHT